MNIPTLPLFARIRLAVLRGLARLMLRAITPAPAMRPAPAGPSPRTPCGEGHTYEGECRRVDPRHNNTW